MDKPVRVRFAPSPTGPLHMGGVRTALYNYLFAKKHGGAFIIRIEDTDQTRFVPGAEDYIHESLAWCGIHPDEGTQVGGEYGPYKQSERKHLYRQYADQLLENGKAYFAFDTPEELTEVRQKAKENGVPAWQYNNITRNSMKNSLTLSKEETEERIANGEPYVIRIKMPRNEEVKLEDAIRGWVSVNTNNLDDKVLFKADGMPTYHLANIVDDHLMKISHVIRGEEWLPSAPLHVFLYRAFGWDEPQFAHLPLILKPDGNGKLSKRDGDRLGFPVFPMNWKNPETGEQSEGYKERGFFPDAFINMLAFLGWNPGTDQEIFSMEELIEAFTLPRVGKAGAKFDFEKTKWFNQQYLRMKTGEELADLVKSSVTTEVEDAYLAQICELMKERATLSEDILKEASFFFEKPTEYDAKTIKKKWKEDTPELLNELIQRLETIDDFNAENIGTTFKQFLEDKGIGFGKIMPNFRVAVTGKGAGPSMNDISAILGKEEVIARIKTAIDTVQK
ncbi:MAG: glutamate--tRNA ligase [Flavobacteriales bacterium]|nr:glutamate--tRNA ligase [Flavobacteriales bacterium]